MSFCPVCKTDHPEGDDCPARSTSDQLGSLATIYDADSSTPVDPLIGRKLGHWMVVRRIGEGGMGIVYAAKDPLSGAQVAVKVLRLDEVHRIPDATFRQKCLDEAKERFRREAEVSRRLGENQPNIVQILGYGNLDDGRPYFVMEFLYGCSLDARMRQDVPPARQELRRWFEQACDALTVIHEAGVVHRDLKPENIWICQPKTGKSSAKLLDFGISKVKGGTSLTSPGMIPGTALYLAPERLSGSSDDPRSDIYAMGVILHEVLSGRPPFDAPTIQGLYKMILLDPPAPVQAKAGMPVSPKMERLILDCLAKRPEERPQTALDLKTRVLEAFDDGEAVAPARPSTQAPVAQPSARLPGLETQAALKEIPRSRHLPMVIMAIAVASGAVAAWVLANRAPSSASESPAPQVAPTPSALVAPAPPPRPSAPEPDAGTSVAVRKSAPRTRPSERPVPSPQPVALQPEPLAPTPPPPGHPERRPGPAPSPSAQAAPAPVEAQPREVLPSRPNKLSKPSKADHDLITNEQILLGN